MQSTPAVPPAPAPAPAKKSNLPMIIGVIVAAILSLCCCGSSLPIFLGTGTYSTALGDAAGGGAIPPAYGLVCVCAGLIPWLVVLIVFLVGRAKK
jgi:hypothetical protein